VAAHASAPAFWRAGRVAAAVPRSLEALFREAAAHAGGAAGGAGGGAARGGLLGMQRAAQVDLASGPPALPRLLARLTAGPDAFARAVRARLPHVPHNHARPHSCAAHTRACFPTALRGTVGSSCVASGACACLSVSMALVQ